MTLESDKMNSNENSTAITSKDTTARVNASIFLDTNYIPYAYAWYYLDKGKKHTMLEQNDKLMSDLEAYKKESKTLRNRYCSLLGRNVTAEEKKNNCHRVYSLYLKYAEDIVCIDCDSKDITEPTQLGEILKVPSINNSMCWTPGNTKGIHMYVRIADFKKDMEGTNVFGSEYPAVDIIKYTKNVWEREDKVFQNEIKCFDINDIKHLYKKRKLIKTENDQEEVSAQKKNKQEAKDLDPMFTKEQMCPIRLRIMTEQLIISMLQNEYFKLLPCDYDNWVKYGFICVNANINNMEKTWLAICNQVPDAGNSSTQDRLDKLDEIKKAPKTKNPITFASLIQLLQTRLGKEEYKKFMTEVELKFESEQKEYWYAITKLEFEKTHFEFGGRVMQIKKDFTLNQLGHQDADKMYAHLNIQCGKKSFPFLMFWHKDTNKRVIDDIIMRPDLPRTLDPIEYPRTYNTFQGYAIEKYGDIRVRLSDEEFNQWIQTSKIAHTIFYQLCDENTDLWKEVMQTFANLLYAPQDIGRYHSCLTFYSDTEGVGKSIITTNLFVNTIIGPNYAVKTSKMDDLFGKYTELSENKILVVIEEGKKSEAVPFADVAKDWLTSETTIVHKKCQNKYITNNCCHLICNTNNKSVWKVSDTNRRYAIAQCKEKKMDEQTAKELIAEIKDTTKVVQFCRFLYTCFDSDWHCEEYIQGQFKETEIFKDQLKDQISQIDLFFKQFIIDESLQHMHDLDKKIKPLDLYRVFRCIITQCGLYDKDIWSNKKFGTELKKINGVKQDGYRDYTINWTTIKEYLTEKHLLE